MYKGVECIEELNGSMEEFYMECRECVNEEYLALFEEHEYNWFVKYVLSMLEYEQFYAMMVEECRSLTLRRRK